MPAWQNRVLFSRMLSLLLAFVLVWPGFHTQTGSGKYFSSISTEPRTSQLVFWLGILIERVVPESPNVRILITGASYDLALLGSWFRCCSFMNGMPTKMLLTVTQATPVDGQPTH